MKEVYPMKTLEILRRPILSAVAALALAFPGAIAGAGEKIFVVTTIPDLADMAAAVGGDRVRVKSITRGTEDMHRIPMKPSYLILLNKADVLIEVGLSNEHAWLPALLYNCRNERIQPGSPGFINCSAGIRPLEKYADPSRREGEIHPEGNPHYNLDPENGIRMAETICVGLCRAYPDYAETFRANLKAYVNRLRAKIEEWKILARPLAGVKVVTYHRSWSYFVRRFGMQVVGEIEVKPGIAPTAAHLAKLIRKMKQEGARLIIKEPYYGDRVPKLLKDKTGVPYITLPNMSGGSPETATYIKLIDHNIRAILKALGKTAAAPAQTTQQEPVYTRDDPGAWEGKEKGHLPQISYEKTGTGLKVIVVVNHVMNAEAPHYIMWIKLADGEGNELGRKEFQPTDQKAEAVFELTSVPAKLVAFEKCNVHGTISPQPTPCVNLSPPWGPW